MSVRCGMLDGCSDRCNRAPHHLSMTAGVVGDKNKTFSQWGRSKRAFQPVVKWLFKEIHPAFYCDVTMFDWLSTSCWVSMGSIISVGLLGALYEWKWKTELLYTACMLLKLFVTRLLVQYTTSLVPQYHFDPNNYCEISLFMFNTDIS